MENKYWQSFAELNDNENFQKQNKDEFREELPFGDIDDKGLLDSKTPRRDFLKYLGFSTAAASLAACKQPVRKAVPYVNRPEEIVPGVASYYATTFTTDGEVLPIVAKVRDARPIKIEGNTVCSYTLGGTSPRAQASVLDLYDTYRLTHPRRKQGDKYQEIPSFDQLDKQVTEALAGLGGRPVVLLTHTIASPSTQQVISEFLAKYPGSRHVQYDAVSYSGMLLANEASFGRRVLPTFEFDKADVIVSLGADFLGTWVSPVENARKYSFGRKINEQNPTMSKHYQFESYMSMTGASADERFTHRPSETGAVALALLQAVGGAVSAPAIADAKLKAGIAKVAADLRKHNGRALVVCGSNDPNVQQVVNAINAAVGAVGTTLNFAQPNLTKAGVDKDLVDLVAQMNAGQVGALLIAGANPAYEYFDTKAFASALQKVKFSVSFNEKADETTELTTYQVPMHHYLESWGDFEPKTGYFAFQQPTIAPLFKTRPFQTSLLKWAGNGTDYDTYFRQFWISRLGGLPALDKALQDGVLEGGTAARSLAGIAAAAVSDSTVAARVVTSVGGASFNGAGVGAAAAAIAATKAGKDELVIYQNIAMASGKQSGNPWLLEVPDPITKATWDNYAMISTAKADELGIKYKTSDYEYYPDKPVIKISVAGKEVSLPALVIPGMNANTIAVAVGYGRNAGFGKASEGVGKNVFPFARFNGTTVDYSNNVTVAAETFGTEKVAQTQIHQSYEGRTEVVKETTLATFVANPTMFSSFREELAKDYAPKSGDYRKEATLYGDHVQPGPKWGMSIDMNSCIGCQACVVACHTENNVPVVGKSEVLRYHDMHWLRIDRYFVSDENNPDDVKAVVFQPMMCQHCDNAPCENVCPVAATMHNEEGINQMAYNRCIGTRYCANNCPYKVRRFNWADYTGADSFKDNQDQKLVGELDPVVFQMNDELTRMVLNPDVTVRSRGVMEKCSFCVQRTQAGKLKAKLENRQLKGDEIQSACAQACPTGAIVFGNVNDETSTVAQLRENNNGRLFYVIEQIHTLPNVSYLAKIRNTEEIVQVKRETAGGEHQGQGETPGANADQKAEKAGHEAH
ncbi:quinol:cytochrome c oxidoreductase iron-sulfur protein precursor [Cnuella takakiae]|uniref:Quinol:cytochrome c oxidoreductase iron-sulfur protein n=1 Tax=Cnuella takakiae TaxID=1302690 RepID=A0A1M5FBE3_9BACT|nr:TAT-variant-translocated molybdopterin oxidoreductase [Cnuella takakiae]OLY91045.1 [Fe-S]-binding protein [Cnuella takakiae]SHF88776.1 quinol:cytochrome c oxidoreductase iron-sulfur protein precursor [Cnuella takakiae]